MRSRLLPLWVLLVAAPALAAASWPNPSALGGVPAAQPAPDTLRIAVEHPPAESTFEGDLPVYLSGWALAAGSARPRHDVVVVIDVSESTLEVFHETKDLPGRPAAPRPGGGAPEGSVLEAEILAARLLLHSLDPRFTRVAVVTFSGQPVDEASIPPEWRGYHPAVRTWSGLTDDWDAVGVALDGVSQAGGHGLTHMAAGLERATAELVGGPGSTSTPDPHAERTILFMTDGVPTLPVPGNAWHNQAELFKQVRRAASYGIRIHSFAVGNEALRGPYTVESMAGETGGTFTPVRDPSTLPAKLPAVPLAGVESVEVRNLTTSKDAVATHLRVDGTFDSLVRLAPGLNRIEVVARGDDGSEARQEVWMERVEADETEQAADEAGDGDASDTATRPPLPDHLVQRRGELLEKARDDIVEESRAALLEEMERERALAEERQRRELELELERRRPVAAPPPDEG